MTPPRVSVIVLNYNGCRWLGPCLDALAAQEHAPPCEVLVVDNASSDGSVPFLAERFPHVRVVRNAANLGFAAGNNAGARHAAGDWLCFLNNDTVVATDWLSRLYQGATSRPGFAAATSRVVFLDEPSRIDSAGDGYLRAGGAFKHGHRGPAAAHLQPREVFGACGAAFVIRRDVFEALGGFDEQFFMVYEDVDLSYRLRLAGYRCWYAADAVVRHAGSGTLGRLSEQAVFYGQRNLEWTWLKNTPWPLLWRTAVSHSIYSAAGLAYYLRIGRFGAAVRGKLAALGGLPRVVRSRRRGRALRRTDWREIDRWLERGWLRRKQREKR
jgi:GT2 family glycosyltransferase